VLILKELLLAIEEEARSVSIIRDREIYDSCKISVILSLKSDDDKLKLLPIVDGCHFYLEEIFGKSFHKAEIIASLDDELRRQTVNLIADRMVNKESYDYNKLMLLNQKLGIDILKIKEDKEKILKGE
jgi:hypothetical protein